MKLSFSRVLAVVALAALMTLAAGSLSGSKVLAQVPVTTPVVVTPGTPVTVPVTTIPVTTVPVTGVPVATPLSYVAPGAVAGTNVTPDQSSSSSGIPAPDNCWYWDSWCFYCTSHASAALCTQFPPGHRPSTTGTPSTTPGVGSPATPSAAPSTGPSPASPSPAPSTGPSSGGPAAPSGGYP